MQDKIRYLRDVRSKDDFDEFFANNNLNTTEDKIKALRSRMGVLAMTNCDDFPEETLNVLKIHCLETWDRDEILPDYRQGRIRPGMIVRHFKGEYYKVLYFAEHTESHKCLVIYHNLQNNNEIYARPFWMFVSAVDNKKYPEATQKYRFEVVSDDR